MKFSVYFLSFVFVALIVFFFSNREKSWSLLFGDPDLGEIEFSQLKASKKPNQALACPVDFCGERIPDINTPIYKLSADALQATLQQGLAGESHLNLIEDSPSSLKMRYVQYSPFWRFPDTIQVQFIPLSETTSTIALFARAKIGVEDFGANRARIERWLTYLEPHEAG